ncbi:MAG TPA: 16S rRNA (guanine(966)-N(2))-methyltransferase RsmD [Burkholderiaceae bacterium]|nr:16S rRNA (guanine(966)-N(2))-methyltransferase RsmD [Burkholderiaceae bacterium]
MKKHAIRIVGGQHRRRPIPVPDIPDLRPTPDRVRETLFNWLTHLWGGTFHDKHVLDLFAGSGALGFEAASRGAAHVQMVEHSSAAVRALRRCRNELDARQVRIHEGNARQVLQRLAPAGFDLVFLDPPFGQAWPKWLWAPLGALLKPQALIYIEANPLPTIPEWLSPLRESRAGQVHFSLYRFDAMQNSSDNSNID